MWRVFFNASPNIYMFLSAGNDKNLSFSSKIDGFLFILGRHLVLHLTSSPMCRGELQGVAAKFYTDGKLTKLIDTNIHIDI